MFWNIYLVIEVHYTFGTTVLASLQHVNGTLFSPAKKMHCVLHNSLNTHKEY